MTTSNPYDEIPETEMDALMAELETVANVDDVNVVDIKTGKRAANGQLDRRGEVPTVEQQLRDLRRDFIQQLAGDESTDVVVRELLVAMNDVVRLANATQQEKGDKVPLLASLRPVDVAELVVARNDVRRIRLADSTVDPDLMPLGIYDPESGLYSVDLSRVESEITSYADAANLRFITETIARIKLLAPVVDRCVDRDLVAVGNGIFNYATKELQPFSPERVFLAKSPVDFVADPELVTIHNDGDGTDWDVESWMGELAPGDSEVAELLWQVIGSCVRPNVRWNKSAWLYSERGNNGKGTLCALIRNVVGKNACAAIPIVDFAKDFALEQLVSASAIVNDENDVGVFLDKAANMKSVVTNDVIALNRKYKSPIAFQFRGFMVQCINEKPKVKDRSESFYRRQLFIPMVANFQGVERRYIKDDYLCRREVLEYVLHRVLMTDYYVLDEPEATRRVLSEYKDENDPVRAWWHEVEEELVWTLLPVDCAYQMYRAWFAANNPRGFVVSKREFTKDWKACLEVEGRWGYDQARCAGRCDVPDALVVGALDADDRVSQPWIAIAQRGAVGTQKFRGAFRL